MKSAWVLMESFSWLAMSVLFPFADLATITRGKTESNLALSARPVTRGIEVRFHLIGLVPIFFEQEFFKCYSSSFSRLNSI